MAKVSGKQQVLNAISTLGEATSYSIFEIVNMHNASVDKILKGLVETGELKREKKIQLSSSREVFFYSIPAPTHTSTEDDEDGGDEEEDVDYNPCYDGEDDEDDEDDDIASGKPEELVKDSQGIRIVFLIRKNNIPGFTYGNGGHTFARLIGTQFDKLHTRRFELHGNAVTSIFATDATIEELDSALHSALPEITFGITTTLEEAIQINQRYIIGENITFDTERFSMFALRQVQHLINIGVPAPSVLKPTSVEAESVEVDPTYDLPVFVKLTDEERNVIERLANDGTIYPALTGRQMAMFFQKMAQFYLYIVDDALKIEKDLEG